MGLHYTAALLSLKLEDFNLLSPDKVSATRPDWAEDNRHEQSIDVEKLLAIGRRQSRLVVTSLAVALVLGVAYVTTAVPLYTATASLLIDSNDNGIVSQLSMDQTGFNDEGTILSQVEVLKSDIIGLSVVDSLKLGDNPVFMAPGASPLNMVRSSFISLLNFGGWLSNDTEADLAEKKRRAALSRLQAAMEIARVGRSYVLTVSFTSTSGDLSAQIANAIADAYITDKLDSKYEATRRASDWLQARIDELKGKALESDLAVQKFRTDHGLIAANGQLISDQQLTELNSALIVVQADTAQAKAKYERIHQIVESGQSDAIIGDVLASTTSNDLRQKYLDASKLEADISSRLGENHVRAVQLRGEMAEYRRLMFDELSRYEQSYKSEYDVELSKQKSLEDSLAKAKGESAVAGETGVQLRELERAADSYKNLYQTFLQRYQEAVQQQSFPITEARVITRPTKPEIPSRPRKPLTLALFMALGAAIGASIGGFRELRDRFFRTAEQVRDVLNVEFLGNAPVINGSVTLSNTESADPRLFRRRNTISSYAFDHPMSSFAETLRSAKMAVDLSTQGTGAKIIGIVSTLPGEGKSTISINFAELLAMQGSRTLLIDCDLRNPGTTRALAGHAEVGLLEVLTENRALDEALLRSEKSDLALLPAVIKRRISHSSELLSSRWMESLLKSAEGSFDYIILDLPPLAPVVDARAVASRVDAFIYVVEWGKTARSVVRSTFQTDTEIANKCVGVVLNKVDNEKMKLYQAYGSSEYYYSRYTSYYRES